MSKIRNEYTLLQKGHYQLKIQLQKYENYVEHLPQKSHKKKRLEKEIKRRKWREWFLCYRNSKKTPKQTKKRMIYEDEIDGLPEYEPHSRTEDEKQEEEQDNYKIQT